MKIILLTISMFIAIGCNDGNSTPTPKKKATNHIKLMDNNGSLITYVTSFVFDGHKWILTGSSKGSLVHPPSCGCKK
jgi:hypothetical protein